MVGETSPPRLLRPRSQYLQPHLVGLVVVEAGKRVSETSRLISPLPQIVSANPFYFSGTIDELHSIMPDSVYGVSCTSVAHLPDLYMADLFRMPLSEAPFP